MHSLKSVVLFPSLPIVLTPFPRPYRSPGVCTAIMQLTPPVLTFDEERRWGGNRIFAFCWVGKCSQMSGEGGEGLCGFLLLCGRKGTRKLGDKLMKILNITYVEVRLKNKKIKGDCPKPW